MTKEYTSYTAASIAAKEQSIKSPGIGWYVSWVEDNAYTISMFEDYPDQECWINGSSYQYEYDDE